MCRCSIIPPHILEALARRGSVFCKQTLNDTHRILHKRELALDYLLVRKPKPGQGRREVYDCENNYEQRLRLARSEGEPEVKDDVVNTVYELSGFVRSYFKEAFGLNSIDGEGMSIISNVHFGIAYNNAYWDGDEMTYGDGDGTEFKNFAGAVDVVAHELTHGVIQHLSNLEYYSQPGALNEHFADVYATLVKQRYYEQSPAEGDWLIGDEIVAEGFPGIAIRSLKAPGTANEFDRQPAHMKDYYTGEEDRQGVHINSGIPNRAFYLCCQEIEPDIAGKLWFYTLQNLWRTANFLDFLQTLLNQAQEMTRRGEAKSNLLKTVRYAFGEVGLIIPSV